MNWKVRLPAAAFLLFVGLWIAGTVRGLDVPFPEPTSWEFVSSASAERSSQRQGANNIQQLGITNTPLPKVFDEAAEKIEIFEKRAALGSRSSDFDRDQALVRDELAGHRAVVFHERAEGTAPNRKLYVEVNVPPERFDSLVADLQAIGQLQSNTVQQRDRTGEFRKLTSQRQTQKTYLDAIVKLRDVGKLSLDDSLRLEQKVVEVEKELQALGARMGDLAGNESFYHVDLTLVEYQPGDTLDPTFTWPRRVVHGFVWAVVWWFAAVAGVAVLAGCALSVWVLLPKRAA